MRYADLCCGIGTLGMGMPAGSACVQACDVDPLAREVYAANHGLVPDGDICQVRGQPHDVTLAGIPCQTWSIAGKKGGMSDPRGRLIHEVIRVAKEGGSRWIVLENVPRLARSHDLACMKSLLSSHGWTRHSATVLTATACGVPQARTRMYMVSGREDYDMPWVPLRAEPALRAVLEPGRYPEHEWHGEWTRKPAPCEGPRQIGTIGPGRQGERVYSVSGPACTITSGGGGPGRKTGLYLIGGVVRRLTAREVARCFGLPDSFILPGSWNSAVQLMGNAVCVPVAKHILANLY